MKQSTRATVVMQIRHTVREVVGEHVLEMTRDDYEVKSYGQRDKFGQKWQPTIAYTEDGARIMYRTGNLFNHIIMEATADGVRLVVRGVPYARFACRNRPIWPKNPGVVWLRTLAKRLSRSLAMRLSVSGANIREV
jgi:hypothetical protein